MRTLAIDSATEACSVALFDGDDALLAGDWRMLGRGHAEWLVPMIAGLPGQGRAERILVSLGPGSFTGLRVGLAAARALAIAWGADVAGYSTLALVAAMARAERDSQPIDVAMTGGHGEWFVESFDAHGKSVAPLASLKPERAVLTEAQLVAGSQAEALVAARGWGEALSLWPDARALALLAKDAITHDLRPIYGRAPDAKLPAGSP